MQCRSLPLLKKCINIPFNEGFGSRSLKGEDIITMSCLDFMEKIRENHAILSYEMIIDSLNGTGLREFKGQIELVLILLCYQMHLQN